MLTGKQIKELRLAMGLKAHEFADLMDVCEDTVWKWEREERHPPFKKMVKLNEHWASAVEKGLFRSPVPA